MACSARTRSWSSWSHTLPHPDRGHFPRAFIGDGLSERDPVPREISASRLSAGSVELVWWSPGRTTRSACERKYGWSAVIEWFSRSCLCPLADRVGLAGRGALQRRYMRSLALLTVRVGRGRTQPPVVLLHKGTTGTYWGSGSGVEGEYLYGSGVVSSVCAARAAGTDLTEGCRAWLALREHLQRASPGGLDLSN